MLMVSLLKFIVFYLLTISFLFLMQNPLYVGSGRSNLSTGGQSTLACPLGVLDSSGHKMS